nr:extensin family protein [Pseudomonas sp. R5(2019)]
MAGSGWLIWNTGWRLPDAWNPWAPLDTAAPPNLLTGFKLGRLKDNLKLCEQVLGTSSLRYTRQADSAANAACPLTNILRVQGSQVRLNSSFLASCPLAVAFVMFERHALQPAAQSVFGKAVTQVDHLGSFACRNVYNRADGRRSQHATANALDIAGFRLADGRRISVARDWSKEGADADFLRQVHEGACKHFKTVLGPEYNASHRDHFHLDMGAWSACR